MFLLTRIKTQFTDCSALCLVSLREMLTVKGSFDNYVIKVGVRVGGGGGGAMEGEQEVSKR